MQLGTSPARWAKPEALAAEGLVQPDRDIRAARTKVTRLDYLASGKVEEAHYSKSDDLREALVAISDEEPEKQPPLRLYVVEDLSRDVIELLGSHLDIEPSFFRSHIMDYAWYNIRDPWIDPQSLDIVSRSERWLSFRFVTARYYQNIRSFKDGQGEANHFNVLRRLDDDDNNLSRWDDENAKVGLMRTRATFWMDCDLSKNQKATGEYMYRYATRLARTLHSSSQT